MIIKGSGSLEQLDKSKTPYRCKKWRLWVATSRGRKSRRFTGTRADALKELDRFVAQLENNEYVATKKFCDYSMYWYNHRVSSQELSPNTLKTDIKYVKKLNILFGDKNLTDITPQSIRDKIYTVCCENNESKPLSGTSKNHMYFTLNQILKMALDDDLLYKNPCDKVKPPKKDTLKKRALTGKELQKLFNALDSEIMDGRIIFIYLMTLLGLRRSEAVALTWDDWDIQNNTLHINKAFKEADSSIGPTKTKAGNRILPIPDQLTAVLTKWKKVCKLNKIDSEYICCNTYGNVMAGGACYKWWRQFKTKYKIPDISYHELRHTNLTIVARYMNAYDLKYYAGWEDIGMANTYVHDNVDSVRQSIQQVDFLHL